MAIDKSKRKRNRKEENLTCRKKTILKKVYELGVDYDVDVALILHKYGRFLTYRSIDHESWPPSIKQIVRQYHPFNLLTMLRI
jgi:hypothetical protein